MSLTPFNVICTK